MRGESGVCPSQLQEASERVLAFGGQCALPLSCSCSSGNLELSLVIQEVAGPGARWIKIGRSQEWLTIGGEKRSCESWARLPGLLGLMHPWWQVEVAKLAQICDGAAASSPLSWRARQDMRGGAEGVVGPPGLAGLQTDRTMSMVSLVSMWEPQDCIFWGSVVQGVVKTGTEGCFCAVLTGAGPQAGEMALLQAPVWASCGHLGFLL